MLNRAPRLKREIVKMHLCVLTGFPKARGQRTRRSKQVSETLFRSVPPGRPSGVLLGFSLPYWPDAARVGQFYPVRVEATISECPKAPRTTPEKAILYFDLPSK